MELNTIQNKSNWGKATESINTNFAHVGSEIDKLKYAAYNSKLYPSLEVLQQEKPNPSVGDWAIVGNTIPGAIYRCSTEGVWSATGETGGGYGMNVTETNVTENNHYGDIVNNPDDEDLTEETNENEEKVIKLADKEYNAAGFSGLGRVYSRKNISDLKNVLTPDMMSKSNTRYIIQYDYDLGGETINIPDNCVLDFQGGSFNNGTIVGNYTTIISENKIFGNSMSFSGTFNMNSVNAVWFGIKSGIDNIVPYFNLMLNFCIKTNVKNIYMPSGTFNVKEPLIIGNGEREGWFINIFGAGANEALGTFFKIYDGAYIKIDQRNTAYGSLRSGGIFNCAFQSASRAKNKGIVITSGIAYTISRCHFSLFDSAINFTGDTHFAYIAQCLFESCNDGVVSLDTDDELYLEGSPNNNIITGCWFTYCSRNPIRTTYENVMWDISYCDFEGSNGTVFLTRLHRIRNCRFERNDVTTPDLRMDSNNICDCSFFYVGGSPTAWKVEIIGNYNKIHSYFSGFVPFTIVSYGVGNEFDLTFPAISYTTPNPLILIDPEDKVIINGYCNKENLYGENILAGISVTLEESASEYYHEYECKKITSAKTYIATKSISDVTEMYISGKFMCKNTKESEKAYIRLLSHYIGINNVKKWFRFVNIINLIEANKFTSESYNLYDILEGDSSDVYIIDVVISKKPLFDRPSWLLPYGDSYEFVNNDGTVINEINGEYPGRVGLNTCLISQYNFCKIKNSPLIHYNRFCRKSYTMENIEDVYNYYEYPSGRKILKTSPTTTGAAQNLLSGEAWIIDKNNNYSHVYLTRSSTSNLFSIKKIEERGLNLSLVNAQGTMAFEKIESPYLIWITEMKKGSTIFDETRSKTIMWNGDSWVNLDGTALE